MDTYPYNEQWKSTVDHNGEEWRAYCETVACLRRYFRTKFLYGKARATVQYNEYIDGLSGKRTAKSVEKIRSDFLLVGRHEGDRIAAAVEQELLVNQTEVAA